VGKIYWAKSLHSREQAKILVRLYREYELVPLMFCGEDVCNNKGPMVSPRFLRQYYFPTVQMIVEPLVDAGVRLIHHCDGDVRPVVDDFIAIGFSGFQGFQYELGVDPYDLKRRRSRLGEEMLFFMGLSVSRTLPFGAAEDVRDEVDYFLDFSDGGKGMFLITSNVTGVEVPPENIRCAYHYVKTWEPSRPRIPRWRQWPWRQKYPDR
jgi:uroporphyrinogen decarboxylase